MIKNLLITYLFTVSSVMAGLPPTTIKNQNAASKTVNFNLELPNNQSVPTAASTALITTGNKDELQNSNFEHSTVTTGWTVSNATASGNTANQLEGKKSLSLALTGALSLSQSSTINAAQKSGVQMVASIWVNSSDVSDLQLCSLKNGAEDKCTVTGGYVQGSGWRQLTVSFLGDSTSNGLKLKSTDTTGTVLVDQAYVGVGSPVVDFTPDMVFSANVITGTGAVSAESTDFIASCTAANPSVCTFVSGIFTQTPNCVATTEDNVNVPSYLASISSTGFTVSTYIASSGAANSPNAVNIICQKQGADYKTSKAYVASSATQGLDAGTIVATSSATCPTGTLSADGSAVLRSTYAELFAKIGVTHGQGDGSTTFNLPDYRGRFLRGVDGSAGNDPDKASRTAMNTGGNTGNSVGSVQGDQLGSHSHDIRYPTAGGDPAGPAAPWTTSTRIWTSDGIRSTGGSETRPKNAYVNYCIRTTSQAVIVGSFQGYNETPGASRVETFSVSYGTTNASTVCSASPCSYLDQIGNAVTSITKSGGGDYNFNLSKTYLKLKCGTSIQNNAFDFAESSPIRCENCNSVAFSTFVRSTGSKTDTYGTILCQGIPQ